MRLSLALVLALTAAGPAPAGSQPMAVPPAAGQSAACSQVRDPGLRALCRAQISGRSSDCSGIASQDQRALCRGTVTGDRGTCSIIRDPDLRTLCRARTQ